MKARTSSRVHFLRASSACNSASRGTRIATASAVTAATAGYTRLRPVLMTTGAMIRILANPELAVREGIG